MHPWSTWIGSTIKGVKKMDLRLQAAGVHGFVSCQALDFGHQFIKWASSSNQLTKEMFIILDLNYAQFL
jgi:hypothetical protein